MPPELASSALDHSRRGPASARLMSTARQSTIAAAVAGRVRRATHESVPERNGSGPTTSRFEIHGHGRSRPTGLRSEHRWHWIRTRPRRTGAGARSVGGGEFQSGQRGCNWLGHRVAEHTGMSTIFVPTTVWIGGSASAHTSHGWRTPSARIAVTISPSWSSATAK